MAAARSFNSTVANSGQVETNFTVPDVYPGSHAVRVGSQNNDGQYGGSNMFPLEKTPINREKLETYIGSDEDVERLVEEVLPPLDVEEIKSRVEKTFKEFRNRRKILIKNLPSDVTNQEVHSLLCDYELKYCFVDKYKGTAFVTLLNGEQAESTIRQFHKTQLRDKEIIVQLQPTDALLCIANLPLSYTQQQFEELVRPFGNLERCFLVCNEQTGHSKGYGFVEYMKKDSAARAKSDLLGKPLGSRTLFVHWTDVNQLTYDLIHSKCLYVEKLPLDYRDVDQLQHIFSSVYRPVFCQIAYGSDGNSRGFAVVEYETPEFAEAAQEKADGYPIGGNNIRVSFCAPGPTGRSMLAALLAAQAMAVNRGKGGLLPEPNFAQILNSFNNPASLQLLLNPLLHGVIGAKQGILGAAPFLTNPALSTALLQLALQNQTQQNVLPGSPLLLQNQLWTQLLQNKEIQALLSKAGILGEPPLTPLPHSGIGALNPAVQQPGKGLLGEPSLGGSLSSLGPEVSQGHSKNSVLSGANLPLQQFFGQGLVDRDTAAAAPVNRSVLPSMSTPTLGSVIGGSQKSNPSMDVGRSGMVSSLLGEPPRDLKMPQNPYLNFHSVLPPSNMSSGGKTQFKRTPSGVGSSSSSRISQGSLSSRYIGSGGLLENYSFADFLRDRPMSSYSQSKDLNNPGMGGYGSSLSKDDPSSFYYRSKEQDDLEMRNYGATQMKDQTSSLYYPKDHNDSGLGGYESSYSKDRPSSSMYYESKEQNSLGLTNYSSTQNKDPPSSLYYSKDLNDPGIGGYGSSYTKASLQTGEHNSLGPPFPYSSGSPTSYFASGLQAGLQQTQFKTGRPSVSSGAGIVGTMPHSSTSSSLMKTPVGAQKRGFSHLIPSPEPSPEGGYIGQHSQGLGGHYADSYLKRKRIF
ncbi:ribonucleoprotein PTB-binding 1 isoform X2 [Protopterus annectens]|uniref:ribonucleoprotein PTB-binding 1 isoform X2 n=1 Tax=Protopterus annectens TaxID=7888 RepID=UPI001CFC1C29|nr:ribonucleoprotein PTB-binding 1 isoform X2 [Protopterus annectens]